MGTYVTGPLQTGTGLDNTGADTGNVVLCETALLNFDATLVQNRTFTLPAGSQILQINADVLTAFNSATSATLTVGTAAAGTQYVSGVNAKTAGRAAPTLSAAQLTAMADIGTTTSVVATVTSVGQPTAGQVRVTILYVQK
jgi:hypothetical protein